MTIFVGALSLDNRRIKDNRGDIVCCCKKYQETKPVRKEIVRTNFQKHFVPLLFSGPFKLAVGLIALGLIIIGFMAQSELILGLN